METKFKALGLFVYFNNVDLNYFYSVHISGNVIVLQGYDNLYPNELAKEFAEPTEYNGWIAYNFEYQNQPFQILLT
jgi:hypothetical protein